MPTGIFRGNITQPGSTKVFHLRGSIFSKPIFPQEDHADTFIISIVGENKCILEPQNNQFKMKQTFPKDLQSSDWIINGCLGYQDDIMSW